MTTTVDWAGWPSVAPEFAFHEKMLDVLGQGDAQLLRRLVQAACHAGEGTIRWEAHVNNHAYRVEPGQQDLGDARPPGVKLLHALTTGADNELGKRRPEGNAVANNTPGRLSDSFLGQGDDHRIGPRLHQRRPYRASGAPTPIGGGSSCDVAMGTHTVALWG